MKTNTDDICRWALVFVSAHEKSVATKSRVTGLTNCEGKIYVVRLRDDCIYVYDEKTHDQCETVVVKGMEAPQDIAVCENGNPLYVADNTCDDRTSCVWKIDLMSGNRAAKFKEFPFQLCSVTATSGVLLVTSANGRGRRLRVFRHDYMVSSLDEIEVIDAIYSVHGMGVDQCAVGELTTVNEALQCRIEVIAVPQLDFQHINFSSSGKLLVADAGNYRILVFNTQLQLESVIPFVSVPRKFLSY